MTNTIKVQDLTITVESADAWTVRADGTIRTYLVVRVESDETGRPTWNYRIFDIALERETYRETFRIVGNYANLTEALSTVQTIADEYKRDAREVLDIDGLIAQHCG